MINRCQRKERELDAGKIAQIAAGFTGRGVAQLHTCARWLKIYTCLTDSIAGPFTVECLFDITLVGQSEESRAFSCGRLE